MKRIKGFGSAALLLAPLLALAPWMAACGGDHGGNAEASEENGDGGGEAEAGEGAEEGTGEGEDGEDEAVPVEVIDLGRGRIEAVLRSSTNLEAESEVQVFSQAARQVRQLLVEEGDDVRRGQVLIRLQDEEQRTALARVESQLAKAQREYDRQTNLYEQQLISEQAYTEATYELEQLELSLADAQRELGYTEVRAPIAGTVTARLVNVGDQVTINQHLFDIVDFDSIVARIYVPEKDLSRVKVGQKARIYPAASRGEPREGTVDRIAPRVDPRTGTVKVTISVPRAAGVLPGMFVSVELVTEVHDDALLVPKRALVYDADQIFVYRMADESTVERLLIRPVLEDRNAIEPAGVLSEGDRIVVAGQAGLKDGSEVRVVGK